MPIHILKCMDTLDNVLQEKHKTPLGAAFFTASVHGPKKDTIRCTTEDAMNGEMIVTTCGQFWLTFSVVVHNSSLSLCALAYIAAVVICNIYTFCFTPVIFLKNNNLVWELFGLHTFLLHISHEHVHLGILT